MRKNMDLSIETIDEFISKYPDDIQIILEKIRETIKEYEFGSLLKEQK